MHCLLQMNEVCIVLVAARMIHLSREWCAWSAICASHDVPVGAEDGMATEDDEDDEDLLPPEMHAEPRRTAEAAQHAAQVAGQVRQAELQERTRLEEDAIGVCSCSIHTDVHYTISFNMCNM